MPTNLSELIKACKFAIVGVANTLIDFLLFTLLAEIMGLNIYVAQLVGFCAGTLNSYTFNRSWTFKSGERFFSSALAKFLLNAVIMLLFSTFLLWLLHEQMGFAKLVAKGGSVAVTMVVNFIINRLWVFSA